MSSADAGVPKPKRSGSCCALAMPVQRQAINRKHCKLLAFLFNVLPQQEQVVRSIVSERKSARKPVEHDAIQFSGFLLLRPVAAVLDHPDLEVGYEWLHRLNLLT